MLARLKNKYELLKNRRHSSFLCMYIFIGLKTIRRYPVTGIYKIFKNIFYSYIISYRLHGYTLLPKVIFDIEVFPIEIFVNNKISFKSTYKFSFVFQNFLSGKTTACIAVEKDGFFNIKNTFYIGNGVKIVVQNNAELIIEGIEKSLSGITCDTIIICSKRILIGADSIISWNVYISDSSQHKIAGTLKIDDVEIGKRVWLSEGVTISYGTIIGEGSIVGSKSFLNGSYDSNALIVGVPAKIKKYNIIWER
ncbi:acyltransferase [Aliarcobacter butzleri]